MRCLTNEKLSFIFRAASGFLTWGIEHMFSALNGSSFYHSKQSTISDYEYVDIRLRMNSWNFSFDRDQWVPELFMNTINEADGITTYLSS